MKQIQSKIGVNPDGVFGPITAKALMGFMNLSVSESAHFMGQCFVESNGFRHLEENLNYSEKRLLEVFPKYFTPEEAREYAGHPKRIGDRVYGNRMGNGDESTGDGSKYKGRGLIQLTGKRNYSFFAAYMKDEKIMTDPDRVATIYPLESARYYFDSNGIWKHCSSIDDVSILNVSQLINLGRISANGKPNHLNERNFHTKKIYSWLTS